MHFDPEAYVNKDGTFTGAWVPDEHGTTVVPKPEPPPEPPPDVDPAAPVVP